MAPYPMRSSRPFISVTLFFILFTLTLGFVAVVTIGETTASPTAHTTDDSSDTVSFIEQSTYLDSDAIANGVLNYDNALQFLTHHIKAKRAFSTGFNPSHIRYRNGAVNAVSSCMCKIGSGKLGASSLFLEKQSCRAPRRYWVTTATSTSRPFTPKTKRHLARLLGEISELHVVKVAGSSFSCVDGRRPHNQLSTFTSRALHAFGGDMGEFLLMLTILKRHSHGRLYESTVEQIFKSYIDQPVSSWKHRPYFYFHSDFESLSRIASELGYEIQHRNSSWVNPIKDGGPAIPKRDPPATIDQRPEEAQLPFLDFTNPPLQIQDLLLESLIKPENQGCAHMRLLMSYPKLYGIPVELAQWALKAYFKILWNKDELGSRTSGQPLYHKLRFVVSTGDHEERAWLNVRTTRACDAVGLAGIIETRPNNDQPPFTRQEASQQKIQPPSPANDITTVEPQSAEDQQSRPPYHPDEVFFYHPQAVQHRREELVEVILGRQSTLKFAKAIDELNALADHVESRTQKLLAKNIPEYNVRIV